ncbi:MAG: tetratricopeptide repeat protein [Candidatus Hydrogenedentes bacterium]|nr:tetratricopeptide repeat protein [Candidatus Hydrogenedentota bacterium]
MDARTAESHFKKADSLYRDGRYAEALDFLIELDEAFPNTPNILFPLARCLRHVGRVDESLAICDDLITRCGDLRALQLREFIRKSHDPTTEETPTPHYSIEGLNQDAHAGALDDLLLDAPQPPPAPSMQSGEPGSKTKYWIIAGVIVAVLLLGFPIVMRMINGPPPAPPVEAPVAVAESGVTDPTPAAEAYEEQPVSQGALIGALAALIVLLLAANVASLYLTLMITGKLPHETVLDNLISTGVMSVLICLLYFLPCLGFFIILYMLYKTYDFGLIDFLIWIGMNMAVGFVVGIVARVLLTAMGVPIN